MFEKCEQTTANPDAILSTKPEHYSSDNHQRFNHQTSTFSNRNNPTQLPIKNCFNNFDSELEYFVKENQEILSNSNFNDGIFAQNDHYKQTQTILDDLVNTITFIQDQ